MAYEKESTRIFGNGPSLAEIFAAHEAYRDGTDNRGAKIHITWRDSKSRNDALEYFKIAALRVDSWKNQRAKLSRTLSNFLRKARENSATSYQDSIFYMELEDDSGNRHEAYYAPISRSGIFYEKALI